MITSHNVNITTRLYLNISAYLSIMLYSDLSGFPYKTKCWKIFAKRNPTRSQFHCEGGSVGSNNCHLWSVTEHVQRGYMYLPREAATTDNKADPASGMHVMGNAYNIKT